MSEELIFVFPFVKLCYLTSITCVLLLIQKPWLSPFNIFRIKAVIFSLAVYTLVFSFFRLSDVPELEKVFWTSGEFLLQVLLGTVASIFLMRWRHPAVLDLVQKPDHMYHGIACKAIGFLLFLLSILVGACNFEDKGLQHIRTTLFWGLPLIGILWYSGGPFILKRKQAAITAIIVPTLILSFVELKANQADPRKKIQGSSLPFLGLPSSELLFFSVLNTIIVLACSGLEKSFVIIRTFNQPSDATSVVALLQAFLTDENRLPQKVLAELETAIGLMRHGTKSFWMASFFYTEDVRTDICILYSFCRVTDDMVDNENKVIAKREKIDIVKLFLDQLFARRSKSWPDVMSPDENLGVGWKYFEQVLTPEELCAFRAISRISFFLPAEPLYDLVRGYELDIKNKEVKDEADLIKYCRYVAGTVGELFGTIFLYRTTGKLEPNPEFMQGFRDIGVALQLTNIARDIITDSEELGRVYIPTDWLVNAKDETEVLKIKRNPYLLENSRLRSYAIRALELADTYKLKGLQGIRPLPQEVQRPTFCTSEIYFQIGDVIRTNPRYVDKASASKLKKAMIAMKSLYMSINVET